MLDSGGPARRVAPIKYPQELPIVANRIEIARAIEAHQVVIVAGETGSGKTTQLPKICLEMGRGTTHLIGHTQPRRLAARTVAGRKGGTPPGYDHTGLDANTAHGGGRRAPCMAAHAVGWWCWWGRAGGGQQPQLPARAHTHTYAHMRACVSVCARMCVRAGLRHTCA